MTNTHSLAPLHVTLGLQLDGFVPPQWQEGKTPAQGQVWLGPLGFLGLLRSWYGLPQMGHGKRVALCLAAAQACTKNQPFYAASLQTAPWATARRLLSMLDSLLDAGWSGRMASGQPKRLEDMALLYKALPEAFKASSASLVRLTKMAGDSPLPQPIARITLLEKKSLWSQQWRDLFNALKQHGVTVEPLAWEATTRGKNNLSHAQATLTALEKGTKVPAAKPITANDESLVLLRGNTTAAAAEAVALLLRQEAVNREKVVLLHSGSSPALDEALARFHLPTTGEDMASAANSILQLLPACLRLHWGPRHSIEAVFNFLMLPASPLRGLSWVRVDDRWKNLTTTLLEGLQRRPGIGETAWDDITAPKDPATARARDWDSAVGLIKHWLLTQENASPKKKAIKQWQKFCGWLLPTPLYDEGKGLPQEVILDVCKRLASWAAQIAHMAGLANNVEEEGDDVALATEQARQCRREAEARMCEILRRQCRELADAVLTSGEAFFPGTLLEDMLANVTCGVGHGEAQAAPWHVVDHPGKVFGKYDTLVWWLFDLPTQVANPRRYWMESELAWLENKYPLPRPEVQHAASLTMFCRCLALAGKRCVLVAPMREHGEPIVPSPWLDVLTSAFADAGNGDVLTTLTRQPENVVGNTALVGETATQIIAPAELPEFVNEWQMSKGGMAQKMSKLRSSLLEKLFECPLASLLDSNWWQTAAPRAQIAPQIMLGNFAHELLETFIRQKQWSTVEDAPAAMEKLMGEDAMARFAAPLLEPEKAVERVDFVQRMKAVAASLAQRVLQHHLTMYEMEVSHTQPLAQLGNIPLEGKPDIVWKNSNGGYAIWDLKYSSNVKKYSDLMCTPAARKYVTTAWQLGAYKYLLEQEGEEVNGLAYWLLKNDTFLGTEGSGADDGAIYGKDVEGLCDRLLDELAALDEAWKKGALRAVETFDAEKEPCKYCNFTHVCGGGYERV